MTKTQALEFLSNNQPMPDDNLLTKDVIDRYDQVRKWFLDNPDRDCIPLFLNSFGDGDGLGVYQLIGNVIRKFSSQEVVPHLISALSSKSPSVRYWSAQIAARFPEKELIEPLVKLLDDEDFGIRYMAVVALEQIGGESVQVALKNALDKEDDEDMVELLEEVLGEL
jgi:hypothetical protein